MLRFFVAWYLFVKVGIQIDGWMARIEGGSSQVFMMRRREYVLRLAL